METASQLRDDSDDKNNKEVKEDCLPRVQTKRNEEVRCCKAVGCASRPDKLTLPFNKFWTHFSNSYSSEHYDKLMAELSSH